MKRLKPYDKERVAGCPPRSCSAFSRSLLTAIRAEAKRNYGANSVRHIYPRAYCIAKPAAWCGVFVVPPCDSEPQAITESLTVQNPSAKQAELGKWYCLAYCIDEAGNGGQRVIFSLNRDDQLSGE